MKCRFIKDRGRSFAFAVIIVLAVPIIVWADTVEVMSSGVGITPDAATKDALRTAVEQVVGQLVDASTLVANEEVVSDKILTYSGGYVEGSEVIKEPAQRADGLFKTTIKARVKKTELVEKLRAENITQAEVSGTSLFGEMLTKQQQMIDAAAILAEEFKDVPTKYLTAEVAQKLTGAPDLELDAASGSVSANVVLKIDMNAYGAWVKRVTEKLDKIAEARHEALVQSVPSRSFSAPYKLPNDFGRSPNSQVLLLGIVTEESADCNSSKWIFYKLSGAPAASVRTMLDQQIQENLMISAEMRGSSGNMIGSGQLDSQTARPPFPRQRVIGRSHHPGGIDDYFLCFFPQFNRSVLIDTGFEQGREVPSWMTPFQYIGEAGCQREVLLSIPLGRYTPDQLQAATSIQCAVSGSH